VTAQRGRLLTGLGALLPAGLVAYLSFNSGGYFAGSTSFAALVLALALLVRIIAAEDPFAGFGLAVAIGAAALMLFGAWVLLSSSWSGSSARALIEFNRVLLYVLAVLLFGSLPRSTERVRWMVWALVAAIAAVCLAGFLTRVMPDVFKIAPAAQRERLGYPIGYWNALGLLAALGSVLAAHLTCSSKEPAVVRVLGAAVLPLLATTLLFTFSRGPLAAVVVGVVVYIVLGRPRALLSGLIAVVPATAIAVVAAYDADLLRSPRRRRPRDTRSRRRWPSAAAAPRWCGCFCFGSIAGSPGCDCLRPPSVCSPPEPWSRVWSRSCSCSQAPARPIAWRPSTSASPAARSARPATSATA
jgi:hypothetical protein